MTMGTPDTPSDTGNEKSADTITHGGPPFNRPTNVRDSCPERRVSTSRTATATPRVHRFSPERRARARRGASPAGAPASSSCRTASRRRRRTADLRRRPREQPHPDFRPGRRRTSRTLTRRRAALRPDVGPDGNLYVGELGERAGRKTWLPRPDAAEPVARCSILSPGGDGARTVGHAESCAPGVVLRAPRARPSIRKGDLYVGEVTYTLGGEPRRGAGGLPHVAEVRARLPMSGGNRRVVVAAIGLLACLCGPAPLAAASTVEWNQPSFAFPNDDSCRPGLCDPPPPVVTVRGEPGERNLLQITREGATLVIRDGGALLRPATAARRRRTARCGAPARRSWCGPATATTPSWTARSAPSTAAPATTRSCPAGR